MPKTKKARGKFEQSVQTDREEITAQFEKWTDELREYYYDDPILKKWLKEKPGRLKNDKYYKQDIKHMAETCYFPWEVFEDAEMNYALRRLYFLARGQMRGPDKLALSLLEELSAHAHQPPPKQKKKSRGGKQGTKSTKPKK